MHVARLASRVALTRDGALTTSGRMLLAPLSMLIFVAFTVLGATAFGTSITLRAAPRAVSWPEFLVVAVSLAVVAPSFVVLWWSGGVGTAILGLVTFPIVIEWGVETTLWSGTTLPIQLAQEGALGTHAYPVAIAVTYVTIMAATVANLLFARMLSPPRPPGASETRDDDAGLPGGDA